VLTLDEAYALAIRNYPLTKQKDLIARTAELNMTSLASSYWPQISLNGQASYQSDVTRFPKGLSIPGVQVSALSRDQYRALLDVNQVIYDGGSTKSQRNILARQQSVDEQRIDVEHQKLKERLNDIWFSVLLTDEQIQLVELSQRDIEALIGKVKAQVQNGTAYRSSLAGLQAEKLRNDQRAVDLRYNRKALLDILSVFLGIELSADIKLLQPRSGSLDTTVNKRPELELIRRQMMLNDETLNYLDVKKTPKLSLFAQGGYGKPGLNMLLNEFDFFYIGGVRLSWNLSGFYNIGRDRQVNALNKQVLSLQQEQFMQNIRAEMKKYEADIAKYGELVKTDDEIIVLRSQVKQAAAAQLENGVITSSDYIREVNAEEQARLNQAMHRLQMLQAIVDHNTTTGK
jgi:outer membrane protein TolC